MMLMPNSKLVKYIVKLRKLNASALTGDLTTDYPILKLKFLEMVW